MRLLNETSQTGTSDPVFLDARETCYTTSRVSLCIRKVNQVILNAYSDPNTRTSSKRTDCTYKSKRKKGRVIKMFKKTSTGVY